VLDQSLSQLQTIERGRGRLVMAAPSGGIPKHERVLVLLDIIKLMGTAEFDILSIRFSSRTGVDLTLAMKRALYRDLKELVQDNRLDEIKIDANGEVIEQDADLTPIIAKSAWRLRDTEEVQNFWGENILKKEDILVSGSSFLVSALSAQISMDTSDHRFSYLLFGAQNNLVLKLPKDLAPFAIFFGRTKPPKPLDLEGHVETSTNISVGTDFIKPPTRELQISLPHSSVSRKHCSIKFDADQSASITDLGSSNYTRLISGGIDEVAHKKMWPTESYSYDPEKGTADLAVALSSAIYLGSGLPMKLTTEAILSCGTYQFVFIP
jgi:hypothetical protein